MKCQNCKVRIMSVVSILLSMTVLSGCGVNRKAYVVSTKTDQSEVTLETESQTEVSVAQSAVSTDSPAMESTIAPVTPGTVFEEVVKDLDDNGIDDKLQIISLDDAGATGLHVYLNGEDVYKYEDPICRLMGIDSFEYLDLDGDNADEIFIAVSTNANCRPYEDVLCLKQMEGKWDQLNIPKNEEGFKDFSYQITRGKDEFDFIISSTDLNQIIHYDASRYYKDDESGNLYSIQEYRQNNYKEGDEVGFISGWGIHDAKIGTYKDCNCIIANQGIEGPYGHGLGEINTYFAYNKKGNIEILKFEYIAD